MAKKAETKAEELKQEESVVEETVQEEPTVEEEFDMDAYLKDEVDFYAFKDNDKYKDDIVVGVNGKLFQIKRGVNVRIPRYVRNVIVQSMEQDAKTTELIDAQASSFAAEARAHNV